MEFDPDRAVCEFCFAANSDESMLFWIEHDTLDLIWEIFGRDAAIGFLDRHRNRVLCEACINKEAQVVAKAYADSTSETIKQRVHQAVAGARSAERRAAQRKQMPGWANREAIKQIYKEAQRLTRETGIPHHVDHIYPLISEYVSGLHVEDNLQILQATENLKKSNKVTIGPEIKSSRRPAIDTRPLEEQIWYDIYPPRPPTDLTPRLKKKQ
jgi:hypothetical protein